MKILFLLLLLLPASGAFQTNQAQAQHQPARRIAAATPMRGWFENPFHGGGSAGTEDLDEIWEAQQAILRARQGHETKDDLKAKYKAKGGTGKFEVKASKPAFNQQHMDATYVDDSSGENSAGFKLKMPWDK